MFTVDLSHMLNRKTDILMEHTLDTGQQRQQACTVDSNAGLQSLQPACNLRSLAMQPYIFFQTSLLKKKQ